MASDLSGYAGDPGSVVTWWRRTHFENSMIDRVISVAEANAFKPQVATYRTAPAL